MNVKLTYTPLNFFLWYNLRKYMKLSYKLSCYRFWKWCIYKLQIPYSLEKSYSANKNVPWCNNSAWPDYFKAGVLSLSPDPAEYWLIIQ